MFCWFYKLMISNAVDGAGGLSAAARRHIRRCTTCREFHQSCLSLGEGLRREATILNSQLSTRLGKRVMAAVSDQSAETYKLPANWRPVVAAASIALAVLVGALFLASRQTEPPAPEPRRVTEIPSLTRYEIPTAAWAGLVERPLAGEFKNLADNTESAVRFLVACVAVDPTSAANKLPN